MESTEGESQGQTTLHEEPASQTNATISDQSGRTRTHHTGVVPAKFTRLNTSGNIAENWKLFRQRWENLVILSGLDERSDRFQVATFLSLIDDDALEVYNRLQFGTPEQDRSVSEIIAQFNAILHRRDKPNLRTFRVQPTAERGRDVRVLPRINQAADQIV